MSITRKDSPAWFDLIDKVRAIREVGVGTYAELARYLGGHSVSRVSEWMAGVKEPRAGTVIKIQEWIAQKEATIAAKQSDYYQAILKFRRES